MPLARLFVTALSWIVATVLIAAALLKLSAAFTEAYHFGRLGGSAHFAQASTYSIAIAEIALALCVINFVASREIWLVAAVAFFGLFGISLSEGLAGRQSCDCFGAVIVQPYYTALLDLSLATGCIAALIMTRHRTDSLNRSRVWGTGLLALVFVGSCFGLLYVRESTGLSAAAGLPPIVGSLRIDGRQTTSSLLEGDLLIAARGPQTVRIVGMEPNCRLRIKGDFPLVVSASNIAHLGFELRPLTNRPVGAVAATMLIDDHGVLRKTALNLRVTASVL